MKNTSEGWLSEMRRTIGLVQEAEVVVDPGVVPVLVVVVVVGVVKGGAVAGSGKRR